MSSALPDSTFVGRRGVRLQAQPRSASSSWKLVPGAPSSGGATKRSPSGHRSGENVRTHERIPRHARPASGAGRACAPKAAASYLEAADVARARTTPTRRPPSTTIRAVRRSCEPEREVGTEAASLGPPSLRRRPLQVLGEERGGALSRLPGDAHPRSPPRPSRQGGAAHSRIGRVPFPVSRGIFSPTRCPISRRR